MRATCTDNLIHRGLITLIKPREDEIPHYAVFSSEKIFMVFNKHVWFCWRATFCHGRPQHQDCFTVMSTWQHHLNILLRTCQECSAVTARPGYKIRTLEIGNIWFATTFPSLHFSIFCQITEFSYDPELMRHLYNPWNDEMQCNFKTCSGVEAVKREREK
jgi:hypothetical protein